MLALRLETRRRGYTVVRLPASLVERNLPRAVEIVRVALAQALGA